MIERALILVVVVGAALAVVGVRERRSLRGARLTPGITVVTGPDCRLCPSVVAALDVAGADYRIVDASSESPPEGVRSLPTVLVANHSGDVVLRRSGRSAVTDIDTIVSVAASRGPGRTRT